MVPALPSGGARRRRLATILAVLAALAALAGGRRATTAPRIRGSVTPIAHAAGEQEDVTQGALRVTRGAEIVECPLRHTDVRAEVSGFVSRVRVTQTFENPYDEPIEAVYVFPLPHQAAVDEMTMVVGPRRVVGVVKRRAEARAVYEAALAAGHTASLLEQERPNIFTQSVGNVPPHAQVRIEIAYVDVLPYDQGAYTFHFPMVVGPRYARGAPDASRINPPVLRPGQRNGHDIALAVSVDAGVPVEEARVTSHAADVRRPGASRLVATLSPADRVPNRDFVLTYHVVGPRPEVAVLAHAPGHDEGYLLLMMQPAAVDEDLREAPPRDLCFLIDVSGSMSGHPTGKVTEAMRRFFERTRPEDRLQVITFASETRPLFSSYVPATEDNVSRALRFTDGLAGGGGTEMLRGIRAALDGEPDPGRVRIIVMLTDGYIGNEDAIIREVGRRAGDSIRFWTVGIGSAPNRHLLDGVARQGGGMSAVLALDDDPTPLVESMVERIHRAQLSGIEIDWGPLDVFETYPLRVPELWAGRPVVVFARYRGRGEGEVRLRGQAEGRPVSYPVAVRLPASEPAHESLAKVWARRKIEDLGDQLAVTGATELEEEMTQTALDYRLMSAFTSFVAVDETSVVDVSVDRPPLRVSVPVPLPEGVSFTGIFGEDEEDKVAMSYARMSESLSNRAAKRSRAAADGRAPVRVGGALNAPAPPPMVLALEVGVAGGVEGGVPGGVVGGVAGGVIGGVVGGMLGGMPAGFTSAESLRSPASPWVIGQLRSWHVAAVKALARAREHRLAGDLDASRRELRTAWLLERAVLAAQSWPADDTLRSTLELWPRVAEDRRRVRVIREPALGRRLDLVLRNVELGAAFDAMGRASGLRIRPAAGAFDDARALLGRDRLRVTEIDLRGRTVAEALDALLEPFALDWQTESGGIAVSSSRGAGRRSAWAYAVAVGPRTSAPQEAERLARTIGAGAIVAAVGPETLVFVGDPAAHALVTTELARTGGALTDERRREREGRRALAMLDAASWRLLAAAAAGRFDASAAAELTEAWTTPELARALDTVPVLPLRSLWVLRTARMWLDAPTLAALVATAERIAQPLVTRIAADNETPKGPPQSAARLYAALLGAAPHTAGFDPFHQAVATALVTRRGDGRAILAALVDGRLRGDDWAVLATLAVKKSGGPAWRELRAQRAAIAQQARLSGAALRVLNRLDGSREQGERQKVESDGGERDVPTGRR